MCYAGRRDLESAATKQAWSNWSLDVVDPYPSVLYVILSYAELHRLPSGFARHAADLRQAGSWDFWDFWIREPCFAVPRRLRLAGSGPQDPCSLIKGGHLRVLPLEVAGAEPHFRACLGAAANVLLTCICSIAPHQPWL